MRNVLELQQTEHTNVEDILREPASSLNEELIRISEEIRSIDAGFQAQLQRALEEARAAIRQEFQKEHDAALEERNGRFRAIQTEVQSVTIALDTIAEEIAKMIDDPSIELSRVIRRKSRQAELKAYLEGLRFLLAQCG